MSFECIGINGFAGDRTPEAMLECHSFAKSFSEHFNLPVKVFGEPERTRDLRWDMAIVESKTTFDITVKQLKEVMKSDRFPILITPRCATAIASLPVIIANYPGVIVFYFDAHGDLNTPDTSESGYLGGMPITAALGEWISGYGSGLIASNLVHIGGRDIDPAEQDYIDENNIMTLSKAQIEGDLSDLKEKIKDRPVYVHLDTDVYDPSEVTAEYAVDNGIFRHHVRKVVDIALSEGQLIGIEITELSPTNSEERGKSYEAIFESFSGLHQSSVPAWGAFFCSLYC